MGSCEAELQARIEQLQQRVGFLEEKNKDLELALKTVVEHGDLIEAALKQSNLELQREVTERQRAELSLQNLVEAVIQQKHDLEIILDTLREHGDLVAAQWLDKATHAQQLALYDSLTHIPNRRYFDTHFQQQWRQMMRERSPLSVVLCDVDYFKQFNDVYGHLVGDDCLKRVAQALCHTVQQPCGLVARYGGEEFAAILPQTMLDGALRVAEAMQHAMQQLAIPHAQSNVSGVVTLSIGVVCTIPDVEQSPTMLLDEADRLLYLAKRRGRNQIVHLSILDGVPAAD
jgi:diguanylate cyclase (GGDEF)-like protein